MAFAPSRWGAKIENGGANQRAVIYGRGGDFAQSKPGMRLVNLAGAGRGPAGNKGRPRGAPPGDRRST